MQALRVKRSCFSKSGGKMLRAIVSVFFVWGALLASVAAQTPDGTVKITTRSVSTDVGLSWGEGVLTYKGRDYPFTFNAKGLFRDVDPNITAAELSGQVFNLKNPQFFNGTYHKIEADAQDTGGGSRATIKNLNGVVIHLASSVEGRKFVLNRDGMKIELKKQKP
ncbi:MAG: hypothetical protein ACREQW_09100 [Candidatus Binatia bacterium]